MRAFSFYDVLIKGTLPDVRSILVFASLVDSFVKSLSVMFHSAGYKQCTKCHTGRRIQFPPEINSDFMDAKRITMFCAGLFVTASLCIHIVAQGKTRLVTQTDATSYKNLQLKIRATLTGHEGQVFGLAFSPNGEFLATASYRENATRLWSTASGQLIGALDGIAPAFSPDGNVLRTVSNKTVKLWNSTGKLKFTLTGHERNITSATFSPDGTQLATGSEDGTVKVWNTNTGQTSVTLTVWRVKKIPRYRIISRAFDIPVEVYVKFSPDQRTVLTTTYWEDSSTSRTWRSDYTSNL
jgi:WD40 repeat protein